MSSDDPAASGRSQTRGFLFADLRGYSAFTEATATRRRASCWPDIAGRPRVIASLRRRGDPHRGRLFYVVFASASPAVRAGLAILVAAAEPSAEAAAHPSVGYRYPCRRGRGLSGRHRQRRGQPGGPHLRTGRTRRAAGQRHGPRPDAQPPRGRFLPRGRRRLKGIAEPVALYRVVAGRTPGKAAEHNWVRSALSRRWLQRSGVAAAAVVAVLAIAVLGGTMLREGLARESPTPALSWPATVGPSARSSPTPRRPRAWHRFPPGPSKGCLRLWARNPKAVAVAPRRAPPTSPLTPTTNQSRYRSLSSPGSTVRSAASLLLIGCEFGSLHSTANAF